MIFGQIRYAGATACGLVFAGSAPAMAQSQPHPVEAVGAPSPKLGTFTLTSVTGYSVSRLYDELDFSQILGARSSQWTPDLYVNNVMNRRGSVGGGIGTAIPTTFSVIQPRTIGVSVARTL